MTDLTKVSNGVSGSDGLWRQGGIGIREAADFLGVSRRSIYNLIERKELPATRIGGRRLVSRRALIDLLETGQG